MTEITSTPGVQGGEPCVAGTRTPVRSIVIAYYDIHNCNGAKVQASLPHLTLDQIEGAVDYYWNHKGKIDAIIRAQERAYDQLVAIDTLKARLKTDTASERIALFWCTTEGDLGDSGHAINERGELFDWWLSPGGHLDIRPYWADKLGPLAIPHPEYQQARAEVGLPAVLS